MTSLMMNLGVLKIKHSRKGMKCYAKGTENKNALKF